MTRIAGSGVSPDARSRFFTLAIVCMEWTRGTFQRSFESQPTWPDSQ